MFDFVFVYEHKARELESLCLLAAGLIERGYSVRLLNSRDVSGSAPASYSANVLCIPSCYRSKSLALFCGDRIIFERLVNLQWEQIFEPGQMQSRLSLRYPREVALAASHVSWGEENRNFLTDKCGLPEERAMLCGHMPFDLTLRRFDDFYLKRDDFLLRQSISPDKRVFLFISSFGYCDVTKKQMHRYAANFGDAALGLRDISEKTRPVIIEWILSLLSERPDAVFVYRPHPSENHSQELADISRQVPNFLIRTDCSVMQWMRAVDAVYSWRSTSVMYADRLGVPCYNLRPFPIPRDNELGIFKDAELIKDKGAFIRSSYSNAGDTVVNKSVVERFCHEEDGLVCGVVADRLERLLKDKGSYLPYKTWQHYIDEGERELREERRRAAELLAPSDIA